MTHLKITAIPARASKAVPTAVIAAVPSVVRSPTIADTSTAAFALEAAKAVLEENAKNAREISTIKDVNDVVALRAKLAEGGLEQALNYSRNMYEVASQTQSELGQLFEEAVAAVNRNLIEVMDRVANNAPAGSQPTVAALKSTVAATAAAVDTMTKAAKQVADFADASVKAATTATADAVKAAAKKA